MKSLNGNGVSARVSLERLADLDAFGPALPPDTNADIMEKEVEEEGIRDRKRKKENAEQKTEEQECQTENAANAGAERNWHTK